MLTKEQVEAIQISGGTREAPCGIDWEGELLSVDGDYGPRTQWWHYVSTTCNSVELRTLRIALGHVRNGVRDDGNNRGLIVDGFMLPAGKKMLGKPWCIGAVSAVLRQAGADWPVYHVSTAAMLQWAAREGRILRAPRPGCAYGFLYPPDVAKALGMEPGSGHGGIVTAAPTSSPWVSVADGNVRDKYTAGMRAVAPLTFIATTVPVDVSPMLPPGLPRLDGWRDR